MRTTVTLDPDVEALVRRHMREQDVTFKQAVNAALRNSLTRGSTSAPVDFPSFDMGEPVVPLDKALRIAGEMEDEELVRRLAVGS